MMLGLVSWPQKKEEKIAIPPSLPLEIPFVARVAKQIASLAH
jgi:hypothetical protein